MTQSTATRTRHLKPTSSPLSSGVLQRKCACGQHTVAGGECSECQKKRLSHYGQVDNESTSFNTMSVREGVTSPLSYSIQANLAVSRPGDRYEREADAMAEQIVRMSAVGEPLVPIYRGCKQDEQLRRKGKGEVEVTPDLEQRLQHSRGSGQQLPQETQEFMSYGFGTDFSAVRVHTDSEAIQMNRALKSHAFTCGTDIFFSAGRYNPKSVEGKGILAHELTHVIQQLGFRSMQVPRSINVNGSIGIAPSQSGLLQFPKFSQQRRNRRK
jgi:hypothetical protein